MAHTHSSASAQKGDQNSRRLTLAFSITVVFLVAEVVGGLISGSLALLADAGHMLTDAVALLFALLAVRFSRRQATASHTFGWMRLPTLAAFVNAAALLLITVWIVWEAFRRFQHPQPVMGKTMLMIAVAGLLANLASFWILHRGDDKKNINVRAAALHVMGDLLGSVGAILAAGIILLTGWTIADPILSVLVSCLVLRSALKLLKESMHELLEGTPEDIDVVALKDQLCTAIPPIRNVHHVHLWKLNDQSLMTLHVHASAQAEHDALLQQIHHWLREQYHIEHATVQIEYQCCPDDDCPMLTAPAATGAAGHTHT